MFSIKNISIVLDEKLIVSNVSLECLPGSITVLMGPNGSGKSSLAYGLMGHPRYQISRGSISLNEHNITALGADKRARAGLFLAFQYPHDIPGVSTVSFLKESYHALTGKEVAFADFVQQATQVFKRVGLSPDYLQRSLHEGFSGGERKRLEIAQVLLCKPKVVLLDEIDSGLDADGIKYCAQALLDLKKESPEIIFIIITHTARLLQFIVPDQVHILKEGCVVASGAKELVSFIEIEGYRTL
jgi:Fe-S cluster assembly ATP-binding protein